MTHFWEGKWEGIRTNKFTQNTRILPGPYFLRSYKMAYIYIYIYTYLSKCKIHAWILCMCVCEFVFILTTFRIILRLFLRALTAG